MPTMGAEAAPYIAVEHHIAEFVGVHRTDAQLHRVAFASVFDHNQVCVDKDD